MYVIKYNEECKTRLFLIDLNSAELKYYPFMISLDKCCRSFNTLREMSNKICVPSKTEDIDLSVFNLIIKKMNQKHCKNKYHANLNVNLIVKNVIQIKFGITKNVDGSAKIQEEMCSKKAIFGIVLHTGVKMVDMQEVLLTIQ